MPFQFTNAASSPYQPGMLFLGHDLHTGQQIGIRTERHAITIAGARTGKGASLIIPNLLRWPHSALVIDPKGENAEATWQARQAMGQQVGLVDPFQEAANVPGLPRVAFNPLSAVDLNSLTARADVEVIADGLVKRSDPKHAEWDDGAASILAGIIAFVVADAPPEHRNLTSMRRVLLQPDSALYEDAQRMMACDACGGLARDAGVTIMAAIDADKGIVKEFLAGARRHSRWLDDPAFAAVLGSSTFDLAALKSGHATLYLVLPAQYIETQGVFLRLFVRCAINAMAKGGRSGGRCLFMLDEFYSLGRLDILAKAAGLMPGYGVHLWPFLQDLGQLKALYERDFGTFFSNADAHIFFGNDQDQTALDYISKGIGNLTPDEASQKIPLAPNRSILGPEMDAIKRVEFERAQAKYSHEMRRTGTPRLTNDEIKALIGKGQGDPVARSMIVFGPSGDVFNLRLAPYFIFKQSPARAPSAVSVHGDRVGALPAFMIFGGFPCIASWLISNAHVSLTGRPTIGVLWVIALAVAWIAARSQHIQFSSIGQQVAIASAFGAPGALIAGLGGGNPEWGAILLGLPAFLAVRLLKKTSG